MVLISRYGNPVLTRLSDKFLVRDYVEHKIGEKYLIKLLWSGVDPSDIPFDGLPPKCIVKTNNGSGRNLIIQHAIHRQHVIEKLRMWLNENYHWVLREYQYYKIEPRIIIEEFLDDGRPDGPIDYRFWCFAGNPAMVQIDNSLHTIDLFYDIDWNLLQLRHRERNTECGIPRPPNFAEMVSVASELSAEFDFVRVDLYNLNGGIKFGELTFTPRAGNIQFRPSSWDVFLGRKWIMQK